MEREDEGAAGASRQAKKGNLKRLLKQRAARGQADPTEVASLIEEVERARNTQDLGALSGRLLRVIGPQGPPHEGHDRRAHPRKACWLLLRVLEDGSHGMHFVRNIGPHGLSVTLQAPLPLFPTLHCRLPMYHLGKEFAFTARVVWCQPDPPQVVGMEFVEVGDDLREWIQAFVTA